MIIIITIKFMTCPYCYLITIWTNHLYPWKSNERLEETNSKWLFLYPCVFWSQSLAIKFAVVMTILRPSLYNRNIILLEKKRKKKKEKTDQKNDFQKVLITLLLSWGFLSCISVLNMKRGCFVRSQQDFALIFRYVIHVWWSNWAKIKGPGCSNFNLINSTQVNHTCMRSRCVTP